MTLYQRTEKLHVRERPTGHSWTRRRSHVDGQPVVSGVEADQHSPKAKTKGKAGEKWITNKEYVSPKKLKEFQQTNPDFWEVYYLIGRYHYEKKYYKAALNAFEIAKTKEITTVPDSKEIDLYIKKI